MRNKNIFGEQDLPSVFSVDGGLFLPALYGCLVLLCVALLAGFAYECWKRNTGRDVGPSRTDQNDKNDNGNNCNDDSKNTGDENNNNKNENNNNKNENNNNKNENSEQGCNNNIQNENGDQIFIIRGDMMS